MKTAFARPFIGGMGRTIPARPVSQTGVLTPATPKGRVMEVAAGLRDGPLPVLLDQAHLPARPRCSTSDDVLDLAMQCAVLDKPAVLRFQRSEANRKDFFIRQILTDTASSGANVSDAKGHSYYDTSIVFDDVHCPHCSAPGGTLYCYACRSLICRGNVVERERDATVTCTPSCGSTGILAVYHTPRDETVYQDRICIGHIGYPDLAATAARLERALRREHRHAGRFFDCCDKCDTPKTLPKRRK